MLIQKAETFVSTSWPLPTVALKTGTNLPWSCSSYWWIMYTASSV